MKKLLSVILSILMIVGVCPLTAFADDTINLGEDVSASGSNEECEWSYDSETKTMFINGNNIVSTGDENGFLLPAYTVDENGNRTYAYRGYKKLVFGDRVKTVTDLSFDEVGFPNLQSVEFNTELMKTITDELFFNSEVTYVKLPASLQNIGNSAFDSCFIENITVPSTVKSIGEKAFFNSKLTSVTFENCTVKMGEYAFAECSNLESVDMSKANISLDTESNALPGFTFQNCAKLSSVILPKNIKTIGNNAFQNCTSLVEINIDSVETVGANAFNGCSSLATVSAANLNLVQGSAFGSCYKLTTIVRDSSLPISLGEYSFRGCNLSNTEFNNVISLGACAFNNSQVKRCVFNYVDPKDGSTPDFTGAFASAKNVEYVEINNLTSLSDSLFTAATVDTVYAPEVKNINANAFKNASFSNLTFSSEYLHIYQNAFKDATCLSDKPIKMAETVTVDTRAFENFKGDLDISDGLFTKVANYAFYNSTITSADCAVKQIPKSAFAECKNLQSFGNYYEGTYSIGSNAFQNCESLADFDGENVSGIGQYAFDGCTALSSFNAHKAKTVNSNAFRGCSSLQNVSLPAVTDLGAYAFYNCTSLTEFMTSQWLTTVGEHAFENCTNLPEINFRYFTDIEDGAFLNCSKLNFTNLNSAVNIGMNAFSNCTSLKNIKMGEYLEAVSNGAFSGCTNLESVTFAPKCISFNDDIFEGCTSLKSLTFRGFKYDMPNRIGSKFDDKFMIYAPNSSDAFRFAVSHGYAAADIDGEISKEDPYQGYMQNGTWNINNNVLYIYGTGSGELGSTIYRSDETEMTLDKIISSYQVTDIEFVGNITSISDNFLKNCSLTKATAITLPSTLKSIGNYAFYGLTVGENCKVILPESLTSIGDYAFSKSKITEFDFSNCSNEITLGEGVFSDNSYLKSMNVPDVIKTIPAKTFWHATGLATVTLSNQTSIGDYAFQGSGLTGDFEVSSSVKTVGKGAFTNCEKLSSLTVDSSDTTFVFVSYTSPDNSVGYRDSGTRYYNFLIKAGPRSRAHAYAITALINFSSINEDYESWGYVSKVKNTTNCARWYYYPSDKTLLISDNSIAGGTFYDKDFNPVTFTDVETVEFFDDVSIVESGWSKINPKHIYFSDRCEEIAGSAFANCTNLEAVNIPDSVTRLGEYAFDGCTGLKSVTVGKGVSNISAFAFRNCHNIRELNILGAVSIGRAAFKDCSKLVNLTLPDTLQTIYTTAFINCYSLINVTFGKGLKVIGDYAFANSMFLDEININSNISNIQPNAFANSGVSTTGITVNYLDNATVAALDGFNGSNVAVLNFSKNFESISSYGKIPSLKDITVESDNANGVYAYQHSLYGGTTLLLVPQAIKSVQIKDGTTAVAPYAARYNSLGIVALCDSVTEIGAYAFSDSSTLKAVKFSDSVETIGDHAFENCLRLKTLNIPNPLKSLGTRAFYNCPILSAVVLPEGLQTVGAECFNMCKSIVNMVLPQSVVSVGSGAFSNMKSLENLYIWNASVGYGMLLNSPNATVNTLSGTPAFEYARNNKLTIKGYTDAEAFADECFAAIDSLESYLGFCTDGHGDIEWLTVYEADCENDGYRIGVCEYCSVILAEEHIKAKGHAYHQVAYIKETATQRGIRVYKCLNCGETKTTYTDPTSSQEPSVGVYKVSGSVQALINRNSAIGENFGVENAQIVINGSVVARTDEYGRFWFDMKSGTYAVDIVYSFGFKRTVGLTITDHDVVIDEPIRIVACDFNKDGKIDSADQNLFRIIVSSKLGDAAYLSYVDLNHDGYINAKDYMIIQYFDGTDALTYPYDELNLA